MSTIDQKAAVVENAHRPTIRHDPVTPPKDIPHVLTVTGAYGLTEVQLTQVEKATYDLGDRLTDVAYPLVDDKPPTTETREPYDGCAIAMNIMSLYERLCAVERYLVAAREKVSV